jgi:hypothetical protein
MEQTKQLFIDFDNMLQQTIEVTWGEVDNLNYLESLREKGQVMIQKVIVIGDAIVEASIKLPIEKVYSEHHLWRLATHFLWSPQLKFYLLLWRDITVETQKATILNLDNQLSDANFEALKKASKTQIMIATERVVDCMNQQISKIQKQRNGIENQIQEWELQQNPWSVYKNQLLKIDAQFQDLKHNFERLTENYVSFQAILNLITVSIEIYQNKIKAQQNQATATIKFIKENIDGKINKITTHTKSLESNIEYNNYQEIFKQAFERHLLSLSERVNVSIDVEKGFILTKEILFRRRIKQWIEAEILPLMYEVWEVLEFTTDSLKMALMNIQNRTLILANDIKNGKTDVNIEDTEAPINTFLSRTQKWTMQLDDLFIIINQRLDDDFKLSGIYNKDDDFLLIPLQSTLNQYWFTENQLYQDIAKFGQELVTKIQQFRSTVEQESSLSTSEKIVRYVQTHKTDVETHHYNSIFLTKGYIGEAFWVERTYEMQHVKGLIDQWQMGFRGSILLHGQRFSGKTLFGEIMANRHFKNNIIRLSPNHVIHFSGRKFNTTYDLGEALDFIQKHNRNLRPLVWIDDIELWTSPEKLITQNIRQLKKFIDNYSNRMFFMVSMSNWTKQHLDNVYNISKIFQADFNLDEMSVTEIQKAILIRHGATHTILVDDFGNELTKNNLRKITNQVSKATNGNIGEALNLWSICIQTADEEKVKFNFHQGSPMPDFINPDIGVILSSIMMEKRTNEYRLNKLFGKAFKEKYINIVQRLISVGLLVRHLDGWLEVNECLVNEVGRALDREKYLKFNG